MLPRFDKPYLSSGASKPHFTDQPRFGLIYQALWLIMDWNNYRQVNYFLLQIGLRVFISNPSTLYGMCMKAWYIKIAYCQLTLFNILLCTHWKIIMKSCAERKLLIHSIHIFIFVIQDSVTDVSWAQLDYHLISCQDVVIKPCGCVYTLIFLRQGR